LGSKFLPTGDPTEYTFGWCSKFNISIGNIDIWGKVHDCKEIDTMKGPRTAFGIIMGIFLTKNPKEAYNAKDSRDPSDSKYHRPRYYVHSF